MGSGPKDIAAFFAQRKSIRQFQDTPVSDLQIREILHSASLAPTARNVQPWQFIVIKNKETRKTIANFTGPNAPFVAEAPVCIAVFCENTKYYLEDGSAATTQALLCAALLGLGACWVAGDKKEYGESVRRLLGVPQNYKMVSLIAVGYIKGQVNAAPKKNLDSLIHEEKF